MITAPRGAKETGNATGLDAPSRRSRGSFSVARARRCSQAGKDTEAAVNLGISTKRLLSALDEAEKL